MHKMQHAGKICVIERTMHLNPPLTASSMPDESLCYWMDLPHICADSGKISPVQIARRDLPSRVRFCTGQSIVFAISAQDFIAGKIGMLDQTVQYAACSMRLHVLQAKEVSFPMLEALHGIRQAAPVEVAQCLAFGWTKKRLHRQDILAYSFLLSAAQHFS